MPEECLKQFGFALVIGVHISGSEKERASVGEKHVAV